ncbi:MAG: hypothetical protein WCT36_06110 [Candidatus Gracilibacteria bacterium]|jgi:hypothetical protein
MKKIIITTTLLLLIAIGLYLTINKYFFSKTKLEKYISNSCMLWSDGCNTFSRNPGINNIVSTLALCNNFKPKYSCTYEIEKNIPNYHVPFHQEEPESGYYYGTINVEGYAEVVKSPCDTTDAERLGQHVQCPEERLNFTITKTDSGDLLNFLNNKNKQFVIGCYDGKSVKSVNLADSEIKQELENRSYYDIHEVNNITGEQLKLLLSSSKEKPIKLYAERPLNLFNNYTTSCYSLFRNYLVSE